MNIKHVNLAIITHYDSDHFAGVLKIMSYLFKEEKVPSSF